MLPTGKELSKHFALWLLPIKWRRPQLAKSSYRLCWRSMKALEYFNAECRFGISMALLSIVPTKYRERIAFSAISRTSIFTIARLYVEEGVERLPGGYLPLQWSKTSDLDRTFLLVITLLRINVILKYTSTLGWSPARAGMFLLQQREATLTSRRLVPVVRRFIDRISRVTGRNVRSCSSSLSKPGAAMPWSIEAIVGAKAGAIYSERIFSSLDNDKLLNYRIMRLVSTL